MAAFAEVSPVVTRESRSINCSIRATDVEFAEWRAVAVSQGMTFNAWARRALNEQAALDRALLAEREEAEAA